MSKYDDSNRPLLFLTGTVSSTAISKRYEYNDSTDLGPTGSNIGIEFTMVVDSIDTQSIGTSETRTGATRNYTGLDIKVGTWLPAPSPSPVACCKPVCVRVSYAPGTVLISCRRFLAGSRAAFPQRSHS